MSYEFTMTITNVLLDKSVSNKVQQKKIEAIIITMSFTMRLKNEGIIPRVADPIWQKRLHFLREAKSIKDVKEIMEGSVVYYNGCKVVPKGKYWIAEEEVYRWSQTALMAPLNSDGYKRYEEVFRLVFPTEAKTIF